MKKLHKKIFEKADYNTSGEINDRLSDIEKELSELDPSTGDPDVDTYINLLNDEKGMLLKKLEDLEATSSAKEPEIKKEETPKEREERYKNLISHNSSGRKIYRTMGEFMRDHGMNDEPEED